MSRLARALVALGARIRSVDAPEGLPFACDARFLSSVEILDLVTRSGDLDIVVTPPGTTGYVDLARRAVTDDLGRLRVPVAALQDL